MTLENPGGESNTLHSNDCDFVISRLLDAPRELVFKAWTDPVHMARWWGPKMFSAPICEMDVRPGGSHRIVMRSPDGEDYPIKGYFREVVEPERIVMTMDCSEHPAAWHDMVNPNRAPGDDNPAGEMISTITFEAHDSKTLLTIRVRLKTPAIRNAMVKMGMNEGWGMSLDKLEELLADIPNSGK
ncbi:MAG TPA: SRPBCC family protein [Burkholderiaceae bacterium]|nr:SRPBCC family protein [Burkholderiaceae bacterium]